mmetsp:Transcript_2324/g.3267  ORF Transcript_2324/g.3267 Transcript_2324/m.3267 type:complete len:388 (-) Transcript_2324:12-1175(-)|eukprot:CAMPEP_0184867094 /NCGR_PEP_ID=MMETSP0580-20130426/25041_1 /TAXON_ID=1118495 /ORGANISM="Dactyliosolen fragilissimus" /LENGTH=387 /DNA_ID=CAMNT_0027367143 /DNA_START=23 /DNA_END=1186 /DNA_ORIENTATION=+
MKPNERFVQFPPRPRAFASLITTDDFLPGAQTLLFSLRENIKQSQSENYVDSFEPELIVLVTKNVSSSVRSCLCPAFCTRIIEIEQIPIPQVSGEKAHVQTWHDNCGLTKLHIFDMIVYDKIVYIDSDCIVIKDVTHLLKLGDDSQKKSDFVIAAAPDIFPPDKFNAGVMVIRPSRSIFRDMIDKSNEIISYDGGDTGFLNAYFSTWYKDMPSYCRLGFKYNAQRLMYNFTYSKQPKYWDIGIGEDLTILHFSSQPKPWDTCKKNNLKETNKSNKCLKECVTKLSPLDEIWSKIFVKSQAYFENYQSKAKIMKNQDRKSNSSIHSSGSVPKKSDVNLEVSRMFKKLRKDGMGVKDAMSIARKKFKMDEDEKSHDAGSQVAALFGMPM